MNFWSPSIHYAATIIHIFATVFWLGWMVFIFFMLRPVAVRVSGADAGLVMAPIRRRVRKVVFWLIPVILLTGLYNMGYRGLLDWQVLNGTAVGQRMLWKLGAAAVLFGIYYLAPYIMGGRKKKDANASNGSRHSKKKAKKVEAIVHLVAFISGVIAAYLGITIGG